MTETTRYLSATAFFLAGAVVMVTLIVQLPSNSVTSSFLTAAVGCFVLYPVARLTWLQSISEWRYWAISAIIIVGVPALEALRREHFGARPLPVLQWMTAAVMLVAIGAMAVRALRKR